MKVLVETEHYAMIFCPDGNEGANSFNHAMERMLTVCEGLRSEGYRPLHYVPRLQGWVCEKPDQEYRQIA